MGPVTDNPPVIVIVGQTASGKTALAMELAGHFAIEVISADARTIYKGMDIGTAKPTLAERQLVPHHLIDIVSPGDIFTVADFKRLAQEKITDIARRGRVPVVVGGGGLYLYALMYDFAFRGPPDHAERKRLEGLSVEDLQKLITDRGLALPVNPKNPRHLIGVIETGTIVKGQNRLRSNTLVLGLDVPTEEVEQRIRLRVRKMINAGLEAEVKNLVDIYGWEVEALSQTIGYEEFRPYFDGTSTLGDVIQAIQLHTRRLAKRQRTWFRQNRDIHWISKTEEAVDLATTFLNK